MNRKSAIALNARLRLAMVLLGGEVRARAMPWDVWRVHHGHIWDLDTLQTIVGIDRSIADMGIDGCQLCAGLWQRAADEEGS